MTKHFCLFKWIVEVSAHRTYFVGLGVEIDPAVGGMGFLFSLPFVTITFDVWSREHLEMAAQRIAASLGAKEVKTVDWSIYAPSGKN